MDWAEDVDFGGIVPTSKGRLNQHNQILFDIYKDDYEKYSKAPMVTLV